MADPKKIVFWIVSHWKLLVILILAGGLAACGLRFAKGKSAVKQKTEGNTDGKANYESLTQAERADVDYAAANYVVLKHSQEAMTKDSETPWVWVDPYHAQTMTLSLRIILSQQAKDAGNEQVLYRGAVEYLNAYVASGRLGEDLASADGTDNKQNDAYYLSEVSSVSAVGVVSNTSDADENTASDVVNISLLLSGLKELQPDSAVKALQAYAQKYSSAGSGFSLEKIDVYTTTGYRLDLAQLQNNVTNVYFNDKTRHDTNKTKLSDAQISAFNYLIEEKLGDDFSEADCLRLNGDGTVSTAGTVSSLRGYKFYGAAGVLAGVLIYILILLYSMLNGKKFRGEEDTVKLPGLSYLGIMWSGKDGWSAVKKRLYRWIYPEEYDRTSAETAEAAALQAGSICRKLGITRIYAVSSQSSSLAAENTDVLKKAMAEQGIAMEILPNASYGIEERRKLAKAEGVLLIEASEHSLLKEMKNELHLCGSLNVPAVGVVDYKG